MLLKSIRRQRGPWTEHFSNQAGSSLIEVLISLAVFAAGISAIAPMFLYASGQQHRQDDYEAISEFVVSEVETLTALPYMSMPMSVAPRNVTLRNGQVCRVWTHATENTSEMANQSWPCRIWIDEDFGHNDATKETADPAIDYNMTRVTVTAQWRNLGKLRTVSLTRYRLS